jgi:hypothetical protein
MDGIEGNASVHEFSGVVMVWRGVRKDSILGCHNRNFFTHLPRVFADAKGKRFFSR